ncbi:MAG: hypothetical protein WCJ01_09625 [Ignavibacteria bacterium]
MSENEMPKHIKESIEKEKRMGQLIMDIRDDLQTNEKYKVFFDNYNPGSIKSFIETYSYKKASYLTYGELYIEHNRREILKYRNIAEKKIWEIQQKKLFDLQCLWRAEMIQIPEIESTYDFVMWERLIENCPFLEPISEEEFQTYREYLLSEDYDDCRWTLSNWQNYDDIKESVSGDDSAEICRWYEFCDNRKGTPSFLLLPDIRGEKEERFIESRTEYHKKKQAESGKAVRTVIPHDQRPMLSSYDHNIVEKFVKQFESGKLYEYYHAYERTDMDSNDEDLDVAIEILKEAEEEIPIEPNKDWRTAILLTSKKYEQRKIAEALERVYKDYLNRLEMGITFEIHEKEERIKWYKEFAETMKSHILHGRILLGEPPTFDF